MSTISKFITTDLVEAIKNTVAELATEAPATHKLCRYADLRIEVTEEKHAGAENGTSKYAGEDSQFACGIRVLAGDGAVAPGYFGQMLGKPDLPRLAQTLASGLKHAYERAVANAREKIRIRHKYKELGEALAATRLAPVEAYRHTVKAEYALDPRQVSLADMVRYITEVSRAVQDVDEQLKYNAVSAVTLVTRELFASSEGACIDQSFALTKGSVHVVAVSETGDQELSDTIGHQRGWEVVTEGIVEEHIQIGRASCRER